VVFLLIIAVAVAIRLYRLDHFSYGLDEILQTYWMGGSWDFLWRSIRFDAGHPPLDYLIARLWESLGPTDALRKLPVVAWGLGAVVSFGLLVARRATPRAGLIAAALLACAPFHVRYSQELRPYSLSLFLLCLSLLVLDWFLSKPSPAKLVLLFLSYLATIYTSYLPQVILSVASLALLLEDAITGDPSRRSRVRRSLAWSPLFAALLWLAYLPWWPIQLEASRRPSVPAVIEPFGLHRIGRLLSFFFFAPDGSYPLGWGGAFYLLMVWAGSVIALRQERVRFFLVWSFGGLIAVEVLLRLHPHWDVARIYLPAGVALLASAALFLDRSLGNLRTRWLGVAMLIAVFVLDGRGLATYFREGRADWRPLARFLKARPASERIFTENQYSQLCVAFYVEGPQWLYRAGRMERAIWNLEGQVVRLTWSWEPGTTGWLVLAGEPESPVLRAWAKRFRATAFPAAEGAVLVELDPALREQAFH